MPRNFSRLVLLLGAAFLAAAPALHAQQTGAPVRGDVDGDGRVTAADARIVSDFLVGKPVPAGANVRERGDVNGDGRVSAVDAAIIARAAAGRDVSRFPVGKEVTGGVGLLECTADVRAKSVSCGVPGMQGGARANVIVGGQNTNLKITSSNLAINLADSTFKFDVTVQNLLHQAMAADSGTGAANANGVRVFFHQLPTMTEANPSGSGSNITVLNHNGMGTFTGTNQRYYQYAGTDLGADGILSPGETSAAHNWQFKFDSGVNKFSFLLFVSTEMKYPQGWVDIYPPNNHYSSPDSIFADTVVAGRTLQLQDSVRNPFGGHIPGAPVTWTNTGNGFATVNASGLVSTTVGASGVDSVTATNGPRSGTVVIVVTPPTGANSVISASPLSVSAGDTSVVTVQVKDGFGNNVTTGGDAVSLTTSLGTLVATAGTGTTVTPDDNGDGTYTAKLTSTASGTANLTGTVLGNAIGTTASVTITAAVPALIEKVEPLTTDTINPGILPTAPKVRVKDVHGNLVPGVSVTFSPSAGSSVTGGSQTTNASGEATVGSWTIGEGLDSLTVSVTPGSAPNVVFTAYGNMAPVGVRDSIDAIGNVVVTATGLKGNDTDPENETLTVTAGTNLPTAGGGLVTITALGGVTYTPAVGFTGLDSVTYTVNDPRGRNASGKLVMRVPDRFWFVQGGGSGNGTMASPSGNFTFGAALAAKDTIFLLSTATVPSGVTLPNGGALIGVGIGSNISRTLGGSANMTVDPVTLLTAGSAPTLTVSSGTAVSLTSGGTGYIVKGFSLATSAGAGISGSNFGTLNLSTGELSINATGGAALSLSTGALTGALGTLSSSGGTGLSLTSVTGSLSATGGTLNGSASGPAVNVSGGSVRLTYPGSLGQTANAALVSVSGGHTDSLTFNTGSVTASNGSGLQFDNADGTYSFNNGVSFVNGAGGDAGIDVLNASGGTFNFPASSQITNPAGEAIRINASSPANFSYLGRIDKTNGSTGIAVTNNTSGTISFGSRRKLITSTGSNAAVNLTTNGTATITSLDSLQITSATGNGYNATGGGTVVVEGAQNTINSAGGIALNVTSTSIGANGLTFRSISSSGGANGIVLSSTGIGAGNGGLTVTGSGTNGSGGSIINASGADGAVAGSGVYLSSAKNVNLSWMALSGHANHGIYGTGVRGGLRLDHVRLTGNNGTSNSGTFNESALRMDNIGGPVKITNSRFDGGAMNAVRIANTAGTNPTLDSLVFENDTVQTMQGSTFDVRGTAMLVTLLDGTADVRFRNNRVLAWWSTGIQVLSQGTASATARITNNFVDNTNGALAGASGILAVGCRLSFNISSNTVRHTNGVAIASDMSSGCTQTVQGTIDGNTIGVSGDAASGSATGVAIAAGARAGTTTVKISNNVIRQVAGSANGAITTTTGDALGYGGSGTMNATITGNNIQESAAPVNNAQHGILITHGAQSGPPNDTHQGCYDILSNTIINFTSGSANNRIRVNQRFGTTSRFPGYTGAQLGVTSQTDLASYLLGRNTASTSTNANTSTGGFLNTVPAGSACPQPSM